MSQSVVRLSRDLAVKQNCSLASMTTAVGDTAHWEYLMTVSSAGLHQTMTQILGYQFKLCRPAGGRLDP